MLNSSKSCLLLPPQTTAIEVYSTLRAPCREKRLNMMSTCLRESPEKCNIAPN